MGRYVWLGWLCLAFICAGGPGYAAAAQKTSTSTPKKKLVVIDEDGSGPGGSNQRAILTLIQAPNVKVLGICIPSGNAWAPAEVQHTLRTLELIGRRDIPVYEGAVHPLVRSRKRTLAQDRLSAGHPAWLGAWGGSGNNSSAYPKNPYAPQPMPEGRPSIKAQHEAAANFLIHAVNAHPGQVTVYAGGPLTDLALAQRLDPTFAHTAKQLVMMAGSISPNTKNSEFAVRPNHGFNFWFDPEAAHIVMMANWRKIIDTPTDISIQTWYSNKMEKEIAKSHNPVAQYLAKYDTERYFMWDELAAYTWLHPDLVKKTRTLYLDTDLSHGPNYGNTIAWTKKSKPEIHGPPVTVNMKLNVSAFNRGFIHLMKAPTPNSHNPAIEKQKHKQGS